MSEKFVQNAKVSAKEVADSVPRGAPVAVTLKDTENLKPQYRGTTIFGFWQGVQPDRGLHPAVISQYEGMHWVAVIADVRSDDLMWDIHLATIENIEISPEQVQRERET